MRVWIDGSLVAEEEAHVSAFDHGLTTGDGVFETVKVQSGAPFAMRRHLQRLRASAAGLGLPEPDPEVVRAGVTQLLQANQELPTARLRITFTGGVAPLGSQRGDIGPTLILALAPMSPAQQTTDVAVSPWPRNEHSPLAGVKSTSYAENVVILAHARRNGAEEAIVLNTAGNVCEGTGSNIFLVHRGELSTPPLSSGCLAGVTRALVLEWVEAEESVVAASALAEVDEAFLTSATRDIQPIRAIDGRTLPAAPGPVTSEAMEVFARRSAREVDP